MFRCTVLLINFIAVSILLVHKFESITVSVSGQNKQYVFEIYDRITIRQYYTYTGTAHSNFKL